ncbi:carotenoid oxygenase family protein [Oceanicoccus sagamiensis]|uniref:Uncharacterized protein n=1 Tax=Oceanicoccus sagamiensis TaxID=716816 RepID=A0A1X9NLJ8_9GAMM|nr:carotenoid oxygenase family protein [Oceanicoccus sagamiensis]ARN75707.1 hypothetical protein BST96_17290 [Oceanicoccus sagamiensis]
MPQMMPADNPFLKFPFGPINMECDAPDLFIEGEIPTALNGTFYRNGPNQRFAPRGDYHLFAGDGMVHGFHIKDGKVRHNNRWVRTAKWNIEDKEGRAVINSMNPLDCDPDYSDFALVDKEGTANTALVWHGGRLLALEEGHLPYEIDPETLESIGPWTFRGKLNTAMTAHPKVDPKTGELLFFAYMATGPFASDVMVYKVNPEGIITETILIPTAYSAMVHDFVFTENYILIPIFPITGDLERVFNGGPPFAWDPEKPVQIGVLPRKGGTAEDIKWLDMDLCFTFHFMNAFDKDGVITVDCCQFETIPLFPTVDGKSTGKAEAYLHRWTIDMNDDNARVESVQIDSNESEFPQCDNRYAGQEYHHGWYATTDGSLKSEIEANDNFYNSVAYFNHQTGKAERYSFGRATVSEPIFVAQSEDSPEGVGYLLTVSTDFDTRSSTLNIFDAMKLSDGPVGRAHLSHYIPVGFHGTWKPGS